MRLIKKRRPPRPIFLDKGVPPFAGHGRFMWLSSEVHRKRGSVLWSNGGYPPVARTQGWGIPPLEKTKEGGDPPTPSGFLQEIKSRRWTGLCITNIHNNRRKIFQT